MQAAVALVAVALASLPSTRITAAGQLEARATSLVDNPGAAAVEATPQLFLVGRYGRVHLKADYAPRVTGGLPTGAKLFHAANLGVEWSPAPDQIVSVSQMFAYGWTDFSYRPPTVEGIEPRRIGLDPRPRAISNFIDSNSDVTWWGKVSPRNTVSVSAGYNVSGGTTALSRVELPLQKTPYAGASVGFVLNPQDLLLTNLHLSNTTLSNGAANAVASVDEEWRRELETGTRVSLSAGAAAVRQNAEAFGVRPVARAWAAHLFPLGRRRVETAGSARVAPWINPLTGVLTERAELLSYARLAWTEALFAQVRGGYAASLFADTEGREYAVMAGGDLGYRFTHDLAVTAGTLTQWQRQAADREVPLFQWTALVGVRWSQDDRFGVHF